MRTPVLILGLGLLLPTVAGTQQVSPEKSKPTELERWSEELSSHNWQRRKHAVSVLARLGKPGVPALTRALGDRHYEVRRAACHALGPLLEDAHTAVPTLIGLIEDPYKQVRRAAATSLGWMRARRKGVVAALAAALGDGSGWVREAAAVALGEVRIEPERSVPALRDALRDNNPFVREAATRSLRWILRHAPDQVGKLTVARDATDWRVRQAICVALDRSGPAVKAALPALQELAADSFWRVRQAAERAIASLPKGK